MKSRIHMATLNERFNRWKETRSLLQKGGDIFFWLLLVLLIIPGPRRFISTGVNRAVLQLKNPGFDREEEQVQLTGDDYEWVLYTAGGEPVYLSDLQGKVIFLNMWATWCPPCVAELPEIQRAYEEFGDRVTFLLVTSENPDKVKAFMETRGYRLPVYYPGTAIPKSFSSPSIPTTYILSAQGRIVSTRKGAADWDSRATARMFRTLLRQSSGNW